MIMFQKIMDKITNHFVEKQGIVKKEGKRADYYDKVLGAVKKVREGKKTFKEKTAKKLPVEATEMWKKMGNKQDFSKAQDIVNSHKTRLKTGQE